MTKTGSAWVKRLATAALSLGVLLMAASAWAAGGRVEWKTKTIKESDSHSWTIDVVFYMNKAPDVGTLPMRFSFMPSVYYERSLLDGHEGPQLRKVPLQGKAPLVESVDVGFLDPGSGHVQKRTKFSFKVTRGHGYEAGEYSVTIKDGRTDATIGAATNLVFEGENEVIDRRAIVFSGEKKKKDDAEGADKAEEERQKPEKKQLTPDDPGFWEGGPKKGDASEAEVEPKRGCGCRVGRESTRTDALGMALFGAAIVGAGMRRRRGAERERESGR